jgi:hypothetical protein
MPIANLEHCPTYEFDGETYTITGTMNNPQFENIDDFADDGHAILRYRKYRGDYYKTVKIVETRLVYFNNPPASLDIYEGPMYELSGAINLLLGDEVKGSEFAALTPLMPIFFVDNVSYPIPDDSAMSILTKLMSGHGVHSKLKLLSDFNQNDILMGGRIGLVGALYFSDTFEIIGEEIHKSENNLLNLPVLDGSSYRVFSLSTVNRKHFVTKLYDNAPTASLINGDENNINSDEHIPGVIARNSNIPEELGRI